MRQILMSDIHKRVQSLNSLSSKPISEQTNLNWYAAKSKNKRPEDIKRFLEETISGNHSIDPSQILELYQLYTEKANASNIRKIGLFIANEAIGKIRDAKHTQSLIKRRLTTAQRKLNPTPIISEPVKAHPPAVSPTPPVKHDEKKDHAVVEAYEAMLEKAIIYSNCDRVIENYNRISKRFNLEILINENTRMNGVEDTVVELCNRVDTYQMPTAIKFNTVIETAFYGFESNFIDYRKSDILETAVDYFLFKPDGLKACKEILESTLFFDKNEDMGNIDIITEEEPEEKDTSIDQMLQDHYGRDNDITLKENKEFDEIFEKFKEEELPKTDNPETKLRSLISRLYSRNVSDIVQDTPDLLKWIRSFFIIGSVAVPIIGPVLGAVGYIADRFISLHFEREETSKMIKCFEKEIKATEKKISSSNDKEEKERLKKYKESLDNALMKLDSYYTDRLSEKEQNDIYDSIGMDDIDDIDIDNIDSGDIDDYFDDDFDDFDFDEFNEFSIINDISDNVDEIMRIVEASPITDTLMYSIIENADADIVSSIAYMTAKYPDMFHKDMVKLSLENALYGIKKNNLVFENSLAKTIRIDSIDNALKILEQVKPESKPTSVFMAKVETDAMLEAVTAISLIENSNKANNSEVMKPSISNTLALASMKLKKAVTTLKDKEKQTSQNIDIAMNNVKKGIEDAMTNDNREAIIKGRILPSASKVIKAGIAMAGVAKFISPVLAVIGALGYIGVSSRFKAKERQMVIDEIEIELKMCEKYIHIAEQKNDMKALKQLLDTQRSLERQHQRIKYKMKLELGHKYHDVKPQE